MSLKMVVVDGVRYRPEHAPKQVELIEAKAVEPKNKAVKPRNKAAKNDNSKSDTATTGD